MLVQNRLVDMQKMLPHVFETISLLKPYDVDFDKVYVGKERDGGYVMLDLNSNADVLSFGVGWDVSFEKALAEQGRCVFMSDHTVPAAPQAHKNFFFEKRGISREGLEDDELAPLSTHIKKLQSKRGCTLKMDVEGAEWDVFSSIQPDLLDAFDQILFEAHWLETLHDKEFSNKVKKSLSTINNNFTLFHVHANNCAELHIVGGFAVANVLELSYVRTGLVKRRKSETIYPSINKANHPFFHDHALLFYPFLPSANVLGAADIVRLIAAEEADVQARAKAGEAITS